MKSSKIQSQKGLSVVVLLLQLGFQLGCATQPFPYFDSAMNDKNRAPASIGTPEEYEVSKNSKAPFDQKVQVDSLYLQAELQSLEGKSEEAIETLKTTISLDPESAMLTYRLAVEYYRRGQLTDAVYWAEKSFAKEPEKRETALFVAGLLSSKKDFERAEGIYKKLLKKDAKDIEANFYLAALYSERKDFKKALQYFTKLTTMPNYEQKYLAYFYRARVKIEMSGKIDAPGVQTDLESSLKHKPEFFDSIQLIGRIIEKKSGREASLKYFAQYQKKHGPIIRLAEVLSQHYLQKGDYDNAYVQLEILEPAIEDNIQVKLKMALILVEKKIYDRALDRLRELNEMVPDSDKVKFYMAAVYQELKKPEPALKSYLEIQSSSGHYEEARQQAAYLLRNKGQTDKAITVMEDLLEKKSENVQSYFIMAQLYEDLKKYDEAISYLKTADSKFQPNPQVHYFLGTLFDRKNDKDNMLLHMKKALSLNNEHVQTLNYLAYSLADMKKDLPQAEEMALKAHTLDKQDPFIQDTVGWVYYQKGEYDKAVKYLEKAHQSQPDVGVIADHLGDGYTKLNKAEKAQQLFQKALSSEQDAQKKKQILNKIADLKKLQATPQSTSQSPRLPASE